MAASKKPRKKYNPQNWVAKTVGKMINDEDEQKFLMLTKPLRDILSAELSEDGKKWYGRCLESELLLLQGYFVHSYMLNYVVSNTVYAEQVYQNLCTIDDFWTLDYADEDVIFSLIEFTQELVSNVRPLFGSKTYGNAKMYIERMNDELDKTNTRIFYRKPAYLVKHLLTVGNQDADVKQIIMRELLWNFQNGSKQFVTIGKMAVKYNINGEALKDAHFCLSVLLHYGVVAVKKVVKTECYSLVNGWESRLKEVDNMLYLLIFNGSLK